MPSDPTPPQTPPAHPIDVAGNRLELYVESAPYITALVADIRAAKTRVWIESYTMANDAAGQAVADALIDRARDGIDCRLTCDAFGSFTTPGRFFDALRQAGVQVQIFRPLSAVLRRLRWLGRWHRRSHRKLAFIDDQIGYFGGMNLVDPTGAMRPTTDAAGIQAGWRDVQVRLVGPAAAELARAFLSLRGRRERRQAGWRRPPRRSVRQLLAGEDEALRFVDTRPLQRYRRPGPILKALIRRSRWRITLAMAYFLPFGGILNELLRARRRGVTVEVIVPRQSDVPLVEWASRHMYERLLRRGIRIFERRDRMLHSKVMVIDDQWSVVGSCNLDPRSLLLNLEFFAIIRSTRFNAALADICRQERQSSLPVRLTEHRQRGWLQRWLGRMAWTFRRWL